MTAVLAKNEYEKTRRDAVTKSVRRGSSARLKVVVTV